MRLHFFETSAPDALRPSLFSVEIKEPAARRRQLATAAAATMLLWLAFMGINILVPGFVPWFISLPAGLAAPGLFLLVIKIDETARRGGEA